MSFQVSITRISFFLIPLGIWRYKCLCLVFVTIHVYILCKNLQKLNRISLVLICFMTILIQIITWVYTLTSLIPCMSLVTKVHMILMRFAVLTWMRDHRETMLLVTLWNKTSQHCDYDNDDNVMHVTNVVWILWRILMSKLVIYGREMWQPWGRFKLGEFTPSYILHTRAFRTYLLGGGLFTLQIFL